jgi:hypothetical protein
MSTLVKTKPSSYVFHDSWTEYYFHDSPIRQVELSDDSICIELDFAHVLKSHSDNIFGKTICGKDVTLRIEGVSNLELLGYKNSEENLYHILPEDIELNEIMTHQISDDGRFTIEGFNESTLGGWCKIVFSATKIVLSFNYNIESWVTRNEVSIRK